MPLTQLEERLETGGEEAWVVVEGAGGTALTPPCLSSALPSVPGHWEHGRIGRWKEEDREG